MISEETSLAIPIVLHVQVKTHTHTQFRINCANDQKYQTQQDQCHGIFDSKTNRYSHNLKKRQIPFHCIPTLYRLTFLYFLCVCLSA